jgi:hypothetical protein
MQDADLVKFARRTPTEAECMGVLERAELLVTRTRPSEATASPAPAATPAEPSAGAAP